MTAKKPTEADMLRERIVAHTKACPAWWRSPGVLRSDCMAIAAEFDVPWTHVANELTAMILDSRSK